MRHIGQSTNSIIADGFVRRNNHGVTLTGMNGGPINFNGQYFVPICLNNGHAVTIDREVEEGSTRHGNTKVGRFGLQGEVGEETSLPLQILFRKGQ